MKDLERHLRKWKGHKENRGVDMVYWTGSKHRLYRKWGCAKKPPGFKDSLTAFNLHRTVAENDDEFYYLYIGDGEKVVAKEAEFKRNGKSLGLEYNTKAYKLKAYYGLKDQMDGEEGLVEEAPVQPVSSYNEIPAFQPDKSNKVLLVAFEKDSQQNVRIECREKKCFIMGTFTKDATRIHFERSFDCDLEEGEVLDNHVFDNDTKLCLWRPCHHEEAKTFLLNAFNVTLPPKQSTE